MLLILILTGGVCLLLAAAVFDDWQKQQARARRARVWPRVEAEVTESEAARRVAFGDADGGVNYLWQWRLAYRYRREGREYQGVDYHCSGRVRARTRRGLESYLRRYPPGARIQVLVNPENPADALVEPRVSRGWLVLAVLLAVAGAALISTPVIGGRIFGRASF